MRNICLILCFLFACKPKNKHQELVPPDYTGYTDHKIALTFIDKETLAPKDTIAHLFIKNSERLDTFYHWHSISDCLSCGSQMYRFADKRYDQFAEGGFFWTYVPDSVYQFTISHSPIQQFRDTFKLKPLAIEDSFSIKSRANHLSFNSRKAHLNYQFRSINDRGIYIADFLSPFGELTNDTTLYVIGITTLKKTNLYFTGECGAKDTIGFRETIYKMIQSVRIEER